MANDSTLQSLFNESRSSFSARHDNAMARHQESAYIILVAHVTRQVELKKMGLPQAGEHEELLQRVIDAQTIGVDAGPPPPSADQARAKYASMPPFKLRNELKTQGLSTDGSADEMRARLVAAGKKAPPPVGAKKTGAWPSTLRIPSGCPPPRQHTHCKV